ncbi:unnamed protein product [Somion occarium]|uniref:Uncharacterized protein n=1 Tax=Somion occarium TaxID=3059160 RepID=A0ABP1DJU7_9APHY
MSSSGEDALSYFSALDELIQLIYQGAQKFVFLSSVDDISWNVYLGLTGPEGRWWRGRWTEKDVQNFVGGKTSSILLEAFADRLVQTIVQGELFVGNWSPEKGAKINLTLGPGAKTPIQVPLTELSAQEAASYAAKVFAEIALQAQSRKCRLNPSDDIPSTSTANLRLSPPATSHKRQAEPESPPKVTKRKALEREPTVAEIKANEKIKELEAQLASEKKKSTTTLASNSTTGLASQAKKLPSARPLKGASLANPNQAARKYQELEFESDED